MPNASFRNHRAPQARPCPVCRVPSDIEVGRVDSRSLLICPNCRHVYWQELIDDEAIRLYYEGSYSHHQDQIQEGNRAYYRSHAAELRMMHAGGSGPEVSLRCVVDFGSSYPTFLDEARASGMARVVGVDFSPQARKAGEGLGIEMWEPREFAERFDGKADVIRFSHVIEHLPDPVGEVAAVAAHLAPGGIAYVTQPIFPVLRAEPATLAFQDAVFPEHLHFFNPISLTSVLARAGLEIPEFFAFQAEEEVRGIYEESTDLPYADRQLAPGIGAALPAGFSPLGGRPTFYGQNCRIIARKPRQ